MKIIPKTARCPEHLCLLALAAAAVIGSCLLQTTPEGALRLTVPFSTTEFRVAEVCTSRRVFGVSCPGCGLTRSFAATARGDYRAAFRCNPMGPILFVICLAQVPYRLTEYFGLGHSIGWWNAVRRRLHLLTWFIVAGLVGQWLARVIAGRIGWA